MHQSLKERDPEAFLAPALMLSAIALLIPLRLARKEPDISEPLAARFKYRCDIVLIAAAVALALFGMSLWHQFFGRVLGRNIRWMAKAGAIWLDDGKV